MVSPVCQNPKSGKPDQPENDTHIKTIDIETQNKNINNKKIKNKKENSSPSKKPAACTKRKSLKVVDSAPNPRDGAKAVAKYRETLYPMTEKVDSLPSTGLTAPQLADINPHGIPVEMISDWLSVRRTKKQPVTPTAWKRVCSQLAKCDDPLEAFEIMVAHGWSSLSASWVDNVIKPKKEKGHFDYDDTTWADEESKGLFD